MCRYQARWLYHSQLPQRQNRLFTSDGGLETTLVFHEGLDLPHFAAFDLLKDDSGREVLRGGAFRVEPACRAAVRVRYMANIHVSDHGFRVVWSPSL
jgi:hypothetical protein